MQGRAKERVLPTKLIDGGSAILAGLDEGIRAKLRLLTTSVDGTVGRHDSLRLEVAR